MLKCFDDEISKISEDSGSKETGGKQGVEKTREELYSDLYGSRKL